MWTKIWVLACDVSFYSIQCLWPHNKLWHFNFSVPSLCVCYSVNYNSSSFPHTLPVHAKINGRYIYYIRKYEFHFMFFNCFFQVPQAIVNVVFEKSSKSSTASKEHAVLETIHMMFWSYFFCLISLILLFWTDLIPGFGDADSIKSFWKGFVPVYLYWYLHYL